MVADTNAFAAIITQFEKRIAEKKKEGKKRVNVKIVFSSKYKHELWF